MTAVAKQGPCSTVPFSASFKKYCLQDEMAKEGIHRTSLQSENWTDTVCWQTERLACSPGDMAMRMRQVLARAQVDV